MYVCNKLYRSIGVLGQVLFLDPKANLEADERLLFILMNNEMRRMMRATKAEKQAGRRGGNIRDWLAVCKSVAVAVLWGLSLGSAAGGKRLVQSHSNIFFTVCFRSLLC